MAYKIIDEPSPTWISRLAINPIWLLVATGLFKGLGLIWFIFNSFAISSPTRTKEIIWGIGGILAAFLLYALVSWGFSSGIIPPEYKQTITPYKKIFVRVLIFAAAIRIYLYQYDPYQLIQFLKGKNFE